MDAFAHMVSTAVSRAQEKKVVVAEIRNDSGIIGAALLGLQKNTFDERQRDGKRRTDFI